MATVPSGQKFHTVASTVETNNLGSKLANSQRESFSMQDIINTVVSGIEGENYVFVFANGTDVENGVLLATAYAQAILQTPNGLPLSDDNRYTILLAPGVYQVPSVILWNTDFIDLACIDGVATLTRPPFQVPIFIGANDTRFSNIKLAFVFLENQQFIGWPIRTNKSKVLLNNCSGYYESNNQYSEEYTIDRDYLNTTVSRRISQNCLSSVAFYLGYNYVNLDPNAGSMKTQFWYSQTTNLFQQSRFDLGAMGALVFGANLSSGPYTTYAYVQEQSLPLSDKYIQMSISNLVGTFSLNDVVTQGGTTGIITETDGTSFFYAYVATGVFPNGTGAITNTTSGGTADNNGWSQYGNFQYNRDAIGLISVFNQGSFFNINIVGTSITNPYIAEGRGQIISDTQMYILFEGPNTSFDPSTGVSVIYNNLGGTAVSAWSTRAGELVIQNLVGTWDGATQIWSDINPTPVTITNRSQNIIHTLSKTVTNR